METTTTTTPPPPPYIPPRKIQESVSFAIPQKDLLAMQLLQSKDEIRFVLNGVHFECNPDGRVLMIATNGRFMGILRPSVMQVEPVTETVEFTVNYPLVKYLPKGKGILNNKVVLHYDGAKQTITFESQDETVTFDEICGTYPKWRGVVPATPFAPFEVSINARYVTQFERVAKLLDSQRGEQIIIKGHAVDPTEKDVPMPRYSVFIPGLIDKQFYGVIMPMHAPPIEMPDWLSEWKPPAVPMPMPYPEIKIQEMKQPEETKTVVVEKLYEEPAPNTTLNTPPQPPIMPISEQAKTLGTPPPFYIPRHTVTTKAQARKERKHARTIHRRNRPPRANVERPRRHRHRKARTDLLVHRRSRRRPNRQSPKPTQTTKRGKSLVNRRK